jgi:N-hydroxyarylamine O-acetyltransferase
MVDLDLYLARIGHRGPIAATEACLTDLHEAHVAAIPFENLDVVLGREIRLDLPSLEAKLVGDRRGGYCFEQNSLFKAVLDRIGFGTQILTARVRLGGGGIGPRSHMLLKVDTPGGAFLADVGFGASGLLQPIPLLPDIVHHVPGAAFRLRREYREWVLEADIGADAFSDCYAFTLEPQYPIDIEVANHFCATHASSHFRRTVTAQLTRSDRRLVLRGYRLEIRRGDAVEIQELAGESQRLDLLEREFGLHFPAETRFDRFIP